MSCYEWERGDIKLPSAEFARLRQTIQTTDTARKDKVFEHTQKFWGQLTPKEKRDPKAYREAVRRYTDAMRKPKPGYFSVSTDDDGLADAVWEKAGISWDGDKPKRVLRSDMDLPSNRTTLFRAGHGATISFDRDTCTVSWDVPENNHAVEHAHEQPLAEAFFGALGQVRWTRGTGGWIAGSNEYRDEYADPDRSAAEVSTAWGPLGAQQYPGQCKPFVDNQGRRFTCEFLAEASAAKFAAEYKAAQAASRAVSATLRGGVQGRQLKGRPTGGQYTGRAHGEPGFRL